MAADKTTLLVLGAAVVGLVALARWKNAGQPMTFPTFGAAFPGFAASTTPAQVRPAAAGGAIVPTFSGTTRPERIGPASSPVAPGAPGFAFLTDSSGTTFDAGSIGANGGMRIRADVSPREAVYQYRLANGLPTSRENPWG